MVDNNFSGHLTLTEAISYRLLTIGNRASVVAARRQNYPASEISMTQDFGGV